MAVRRTRPVMDPTAGRDAAPEVPSQHENVYTEAQHRADLAAAMRGDEKTEKKVKPVRVTLDLPPADHRALKRLSDDMADELGRTRVSLQSVLAVLARRVVSDQELRDVVIAELRG